MKIRYKEWFWEDQSPESLEEMIERLPSFRREKALSYVFEQDRVLCAKSYLMLCDILEEILGRAVAPDFIFGAGGKPHLKDMDGFFSLSHCPKGILCVVSDMEVGCDIEEIPETLDMDMCRMCMNDEEISGILSSKEANREFTRLWTVKEAYLKLTGEGLVDALPDVLSKSVLSRVAFSTALHPDKGCVSTIATYK